MKSTLYIKRRIGPVAVLLMTAVFLMGWPAHEAEAQWSTKWLAAGKLQHPYLSGGSEPEALVTNVYNFWPGHIPNSGHSRWKGLWISGYANGELRASHIGPRELGMGQMFDEDHRLVARFDLPEVLVDGLETFNRPVVVDDVDSGIPADHMVVNRANSNTGITMERRVMQFSQEYHDSYHLSEYTFTNTGNPEEGLEAVTMEDVYFILFERPTIYAPAGRASSDNSIEWGRFTMVDAVGDGFEDYGVDFRAQFAWQGHLPSRTDQFNTIGNPMFLTDGANPVEGDSLGRLAGAQMVGSVTIYAPGQAHAPGELPPDDPAQPRLMSYVDSDWTELTTGHETVQDWEWERDFFERGAQGTGMGPPGQEPRVTPTHAYTVHPGGDFVNQTAAPDHGRAGGWGYASGYGPYRLEPGEQVRIVVADGVAGLSDHAKQVIGRAYKLSGANDNLEIEYQDEEGNIVGSMTKNEWVMTTRDSLFQLFERAIANYENNLNIPQPPLPPQRFSVTSETDRVLVEWEPFPGEDPPHGWEIYRASHEYYGVPGASRLEGGMGIPDSSRVYQLVHEAAPGDRSWADTDLERGTHYFYYMQAVGNVNEDGSGLTPTGNRLRSSRYWTQTYEGATLKRPPGEGLDDLVIVPNPYNLSSSTDIRFGAPEDRLAFFGMPGQATIRIYTELGELVETIEHTDGSGDAFWDLTTSSRQVIASGIYLAVIQDEDSGSATFGQNVVKKFIIIR